MASHANDKLVSALSQLAEAYAELQEELEEKFNSGEREEDDDFEDEENDDEEALAEEVDAAMVSELKLAIDSVIDSDDVATEEFAAIFSALVDALEEIDPNCFSEIEEDTDSDDDDDDFDDGDEEIDLNDYDDDDYDDDDDDDYEDDDDDYEDDDDDDDDNRPSRGRRKRR